MCIPKNFTHCNFRQQIVELNTFSGKSWDRKSEYGLFKEKMLYKKRVFHTNHRLSWNLENLSLFNSGNRKYSTLQSKRINTNKLPMILTAMADLRSGWIHLKFAINRYATEKKFSVSRNIFSYVNQLYDYSMLRLRHRSSQTTVLL